MRNPSPLEYLCLGASLNPRLPGPDQNIKLPGSFLSSGHSGILSFAHVEVLTPDDFYAILVCFAEQTDAQGNDIEPSDIAIRGHRYLAMNLYPIPEQIVLHFLLSRCLSGFDSVG
jgi:hypothetical protein